MEIFLIEGFGFSMIISEDLQKGLSVDVNYLLISSMDYQYEGTYSCFAENSEGNATSLTIVEMLGKV